MASAVTSRYFVSPSRNVLIDVQPTFYPIANSAALDVCEDIPPSTPSEPLRVGLLAAGDIRNVLYTTYRRVELKDCRPIEFYVNDCNPAIIARDILLLRVAAQCPLQNEAKIKQHTDLFLSLWADVAISKSNRKKLDAMMTHHLEAFTGAGDDDEFMTLSQQHQLWLVKKTWALWLAINKDSTYKRDYFLALPELEAFKYAPDLTISRRSELLHYFENGWMLREELSRNRCCLNPTLRDPDSRALFSFESNPYNTYNSTTKACDYVNKAQSLYETLRNAVQRLLTAFAQQVAERRIRVIFDVGDCFAYLATRLSSDIYFDAIDTSNLVDYSGLTAVLVATAPRLKRDTHSTIWTESVKGQNFYSNVDKLLKNTLFIPYSLLPTILQIKGIFPFESGLDIVKELGLKHRSNFLTGIKMKWICAHFDSSYQLDLVPQPHHCVFRNMIKTALKDLYSAYTGEKAIDLNYQKRYGYYPHFLHNTLQSLMLALLSASRFFRFPRDLFEHLYSQVQSDKWSVLAFEVERLACQLCPIELQPKKKLQSLIMLPPFSSLPFEMYVTTLRPLESARFYPSYLAGILVKDFTETDYKTVTRRSNEAITSLQRWIILNCRRLQFLEEFTMSYKVKELEICFPVGVVHPRSKFTLLVVAINEGCLLFRPLQLRNFRMQLGNLVEIKPFQLQAPRRLIDGSENTGELFVTQMVESSDSVSILLCSALPLPANLKIDIRPTDVTGSCQIILDRPQATQGPLAVHLSLPNCFNSSPLLRKADCSWHLLEDKKSVRVKVSKVTLKPLQELLDLKSLRKWPVNRKLDIGAAIFTNEEKRILEKDDQEFIGRDTYFDARASISEMFSLFFRTREKVFYNTSSLRKGFEGMISNVLTSPRGIPILEFLYVYTEHSEGHKKADRFRAYKKTVRGKLIVGARGSNQEMDYLKEQFARNSLRMSNSATVTVGGVRLQRSFLIPLYPTERKMCERELEASFKELLDERMTSSPPSQLQVPHEYKEKLGEKTCFTCSSLKPGLKVCAKCNQAWYCDRSCQQRGWKSHKPNCRSTKD